MKKKFDWSLLLVLAENLLLGATCSVCEEADLRCSIGRSYYGAFHRAKDKAIDKWHESFSQGSDIHLQVQRAFAQHGETTIADNLKDMRMTRNQADYDEYVPDLENSAREMLLLAQETIADLDQL